ncbi:MAG: hypothetical protein JST87_07240 [Bacteroidetes bacterium]|nr:hypothetical protein [Bacteroidota bacterium]
MVYQYIVTLKKDNENAIDIINVILCFFSSLFFLFTEFPNHISNLIFTIAPLVIIAGVVFNLYRKLKAKKTVRFRGLILLTGICWVGMPYMKWLAVLFVILFFLEFQAKRPLEVGFTDDNVVINSLIKRTFAWSDFTNIVLKDGLLTLDFSNNTLFQKETLDDDEPDAEEDEFNDYCRTRLGKTKIEESI